MKKIMVLLAALFFPMMMNANAAEATLEQITEKINSSAYYHEGMKEGEVLEATSTGDTTNGEITVTWKQQLQETEGNLNLDVAIDSTTTCKVTDGVIACDLDLSSFTGDIESDEQMLEFFEKFPNFMATMLIGNYLIPDAVAQVYGSEDGEVMKMLTNEKFADQIQNFTVENDGFGMVVGVNLQKLTYQISTKRAITKLTEETEGTKDPEVTNPEDPKDEEKEEVKTENPQTGITSPLVYGGALLALVGLNIIIFKKCKNQ